MKKLGTTPKTRCVSSWVISIWAMRTWSASTWTVVVTAECRAKVASRRSWPAVSEPEVWTDANPSAAMERVNGPGGRLAKVKLPSSPEVATLPELAAMAGPAIGAASGDDGACRVRVMRAPGMASPSLSVTVPPMEPGAGWTEDGGLGAAGSWASVDSRPRRRGAERYNSEGARGGCTGFIARSSCMDRRIAGVFSCGRRGC